MSTNALPADNPLDPNSAALGEQAWIEVIQKMDEVYNDLLIRSGARGKECRT
jgi:two-component system sensor histidine kinase HupT/HoxJ